MNNGHWKFHKYININININSECTFFCKGKQAYTRLFGPWPSGQGGGMLCICPNTYAKNRGGISWNPGIQDPFFYPIPYQIWNSMSF